jgi:excisionase family DNA binding protein
VLISRAYDVDELAEYLKVSTSTVYKMLRNGHLPFLKIGSGFRFDKHEIDRWIAARESKN